MVNTDKEEEIARIKTSLPDNQKDLVKANPVWGAVLLMQNMVYMKIAIKPKVSGLFGIHENLGLILDVLPLITYFEGQKHLARQQVPSRIRRTPVPTSPEGLEQYKKI